MKPRTRTALFRAISIALGVALPIVVAEALGSIGLHYEKQQLRALERAKAEQLNVVVRDRGIATIADPYLLFRIAPNTQHRHVQTNEYGLRNDPISRKPGPDTFRVLVLGGSVAWGYTSRSNDETISALLQHYLNEHAEDTRALAGKTVEVLNAGVPGYIAWQSALAYARHYREFEPDVIISIDGANDVISAIDTGMPGVPLRYKRQKSAYLTSKPTLLGNLWKWLAFRAHEMKIVRYLNSSEKPQLAITQLFRRWEPRQIDEADLPSIDAVRGEYRAALVHLSDLARIDGALLVPVLQPLVILRGSKPLDAFESEIVREFDTLRPDQIAYYEAGYAAFQAMYAELAEQRPDLLLLDTTQVFRDTTGTAYTDYCHLTQPGRQLLVQAIGSALLAKLDDPGDEADFASSHLDPMRP